MIQRDEEGGKAEVGNFSGDSIYRIIRIQHVESQVEHRSKMQSQHKLLLTSWFCSIVNNGLTEHLDIASS